LLKGNRTEPVEIKVFDIYGRLIYQTKGALDDKYTFGEHFTVGVYIVKILQGESVATIKIVKG
jgi:hypothetical protein